MLNQFERSELVVLQRERRGLLLPVTKNWHRLALNLFGSSDSPATIEFNGSSGLLTICFRERTARFRYYKNIIREASEGPETHTIYLTKESYWTIGDKQIPITRSEARVIACWIKHAFRVADEHWGRSIAPRVLDIKADWDSVQNERYVVTSWTVNFCGNAILTLETDAVVYRQDGRKVRLLLDVDRSTEGAPDNILFLPLPLFWDSPHENEAVTEEERDDIKVRLVRGLRILGRGAEVADVSTLPELQ